MKHDPNWAKWTEWLGKEPKPGTISKDVFGMLAARQIWENFQEIVRVAPQDAKKIATFHSWFNASYLQAQGLAVRRQVEVRDNIVSLGRLLDRVAKSPSVLSRDRYLAELYPDDYRDGNELFDQLVAPGANMIDGSVPVAELEHLRRETSKVRNWINKEVAHYDPKTGKFSEDLTFGDVHSAIDLIFVTYNRYCELLLGAKVLGSVVMQPWEMVFTVAWIPDSDALRQVQQAAFEREHRRTGTV